MPQLSKEEVKKIIADNWLIKSNKDIGEMCGGLSFDTIRSRARAMNLPSKGEDFKVKLKAANEAHEALKTNCEEVGIPLEDVKHYWHKGKHFSVFAKGKELGLEELRNDILEAVKEHAPKYPNIYYPLITDSHLLVVDPADIHIGKLCKAFETNDEYSHEIAIDRVKSGVSGLLQKAQGFPIDKILLIIGNDVLHVDNAKSSTTSGTHQDSNLMWYDAFKIALKLYVEVIEMLLTVAPVFVQYDPSNHDYTNGFMLAQTVEAWFRNNENISFNTSIAHRKYFTYGNSLIGTTHGDGAKETDLALLMAHESKDWQNCKHRYFYTHHIHHKKSKDYMSVCVESLRSPSGTDSWHHRQGYAHSPKAVEAFIHHKEHGQICRLTNLF